MTHKNNAHTPGPWEVEKLAYPGRLDVSFEVKSTSRFVCQTIMREVIEEDDLIAEDAANARLIAAAPELLSALKAVTKLNGTTADHSAWQMAHAAIAKAHGK